MNSDSQKVFSLGFFLLVPIFIATLSYGVLKGDGDPVEVVREARRPRNIFDDLSDMHLNYSRGKWAEALQAARRVLARDPDREDALRVVASCELKRKRPGRAAVALKALLKAVPEDVGVRVYLAQALLQLRQSEESREQWRQVEASPYATLEERRLAREALRILDDPLGGLLPPPPSRSAAPEGKTDRDRVQ